jgi:hypothetical protein
VLVAIAVSGITATLLSTPFQIHYAAPFAAVFTAISAETFRRLWALQRSRIWIGPCLAIAVPPVLLWTALSGQLAASPTPRLAQRPIVTQQLLKIPGRHLVIVRYGPHHVLGEEWVYNGPDIDAEPIVWTRDLGDRENEEILSYYRDRHVWLLEADSDPAAVTSYRLERR